MGAADEGVRDCACAGSGPGAGSGGPCGEKAGLEAGLRGGARVGRRGQTRFRAPWRQAGFVAGAWTRAPGVSAGGFPGNERGLPGAECPRP